MSVLRACATLAISLAAGSWLGLGKPGAGAPAKKPATPQVEVAIAPDFAPIPHDEAMPSITPWHALNPEASTSRAWLLAEGPARFPGRRLVTFTFDDGPMPGPTGSILRLLDKHRVKATFFLIGRYLDGDDERAIECRKLANRELAAGHLVGNHTHDHDNLVQVSPTQALAQIDRGTTSIERATGKRPFLFRPPFGKLDEFGQRAVAARNLDLVLWSIEAEDMERTDVDGMVADILAQVDKNEGGIVLLHDARKSTYAVLQKLLEYMRARRWNVGHPERGGYDIVDLPQYLRETAESPLPYSSREEVERARGGNAVFGRR